MMCRFTSSLIVSLALAVLLIVPGSLSAQSSSNCFNGGPACPPLGAAVSITIGGGGASEGESGSSGGGGSREATLGDVRMQGLGYPGGVVTLLMDGGIKASFLVGSDGVFSRTLTNIPIGIHAFNAYGEDPLGNISPTIGLSISVAGGTVTTISGLILPPTMNAVSPVEQGKPAIVSGYSFPDANVYLFFTSGVPVAQTQAGLDGLWYYAVDTSGWSKGIYEVRSRAQTNVGEQSEFSQSVRLEVRLQGEIPEEPLPPVEPRPVTCSADFNGDHRVNLTDFSILLYYWKRTTSECYDLSGDGKVDIVDLSILLYWWTG